MKYLILISLITVTCAFVPNEVQEPFYHFKHKTSGDGSSTATDNFTRADANPISNPMSDGTSTWLTNPTGWSAMQIQSHQAINTSGSWCGAMVFSPSFPSAQTMTGTIGTQVSGSFLGVRMQSGSGGCYAVVVDNATTLHMYISGTGGFGSLTSEGTITVSTLATGVTYGIQASGTTITIYRNGVNVGGFTDGANNFPTGQPAMGSSGPGNFSLIQATTP